MLTPISLKSPLTTYAQQIRKHGLAATINQGVHAVQHGYDTEAQNAIEHRTRNTRADDNRFARSELASIMVSAGLPDIGGE